MDDASAENLDWFWRGWFYSTEPVDLSLDSVKWFKPDLENFPKKIDSVRMQNITKPQVNSYEDVSKIRNRQDKNITFLTDADTSLRDFYWKYDRGIIPYDSTKYEYHVQQYDEPLDDATKQKLASKNLYELTFSNKGGLPMPIILEWTYADGTKEIERIPAQVWRLNENKITKSFIKEKEVSSVKLDPNRETADIDESNNSWPKVPEQTKFQIYKAKQQQQRMIPNANNPMQKAAEKEKKPF
jgi:hypothetical protein